jgi:hypothetical protein
MAVAGVGLLAACGGSYGDDDDNSGGNFDRGSVAGSLADNALAESAGAAPDDEGGGTAGYQGSLLDRKIIFTANLDLEAADVRTAFDRASLIARQSGGFVERSSLSSRDGDDGEPRTYATITVRVPVAQYDAVLNDLRSMSGVSVLTEESSSTEVTEEYTDLESRLRNLERTESQYLVLLERAETINDILTVNDRLDGVRGQIEQIQGRLALLDDLSDLATVSMSIAPADVGDVEKPGADKSFGQVFADAMEWSGDTISAIGAGSAYLVVAAMWLVVPALIVLAAIRFTRRRRESSQVPTG